MPESFNYGLRQTLLGYYPAEYDAIMQRGELQILDLLTRLASACFTGIYAYFVFRYAVSLGVLALIASAPVGMWLSLVLLSMRRSMVVKLWSETASDLCANDRKISQDVRVAKIVSARCGTVLLTGGHWLGRLLPRKPRQEFYDPAHWDIVGDWLEVRDRGLSLRCWMLICILVQIVLNFMNSLIRGVLASLIDVFRPGI